jgi:hypothetical protein
MMGEVDGEKCPLVVGVRRRFPSGFHGSFLEVMWFGYV